MHAYIYIENVTLQMKQVMEYFAGKAEVETVNFIKSRHIRGQNRLKSFLSVQHSHQTCHLFINGKNEHNVFSKPRNCTQDQKSHIFTSNLIQ